jgi:hypothetical protein
MAANTGERTLIPALIPPGAAHVNVVFSFGFPDQQPVMLAAAAASASSLLADFVVRVAPKSNIYQGVFERLPCVVERRLRDLMVLRLLRLAAVTQSFSELWTSVWQPTFATDSWAGGRERPNRPGLAVHSDCWNRDVPLRLGADRRQALLEIDVLIAIGLGVTADELCTIYRTQFPVLRGYDRGQYVYDANGRLVPVVIRQNGGGAPAEDRTTSHPESGVTYVYEPPFSTLDREADIREAYRAFELRLISSA